MDLNFEQLKELLKEINDSSLSELHLECKDTKVTLKKNYSMVVEEFTSVQPSVARPQPPISIQADTKVKEEVSVKSEPQIQSNHVTITSPMVGTFYRAPSPTAKPFVEVGDRINPGQTICIIEAMKLMNDMPSEISGKIVKICVENGTTIEFGQNLFIVDPQG